MGFRICWLAFHDKSRGDVLADLRLIDTGTHDETNESDMSVADFPDGWTVLWLNRFDHPFAEDSSVRLFSKSCTVIVGHVHEGIMFAATECYRDGAPVWAVIHDSGEGRYHLETEGEPPPSFASIQAAHIARQKEADSENVPVDHIHGIAFAVARTLCAFEYDRWRYDWGQPHFTAVRHKDQLS